MSPATGSPSKGQEAVSSKDDKQTCSDRNHKKASLSWGKPLGSSGCVNVQPLAEIYPEEKWPLPSKEPKTKREKLNYPPLSKSLPSPPPAKAASDDATERVPAANGSAGSDLPVSSSSAPAPATNGDSGDADSTVGSELEKLELGPGREQVLAQLGYSVNAEQVPARSELLGKLDSGDDDAVELGPEKEKIVAELVNAEEVVPVPATSGGGGELSDVAVWSAHYDACTTRTNPRSDPKQSFASGGSYVLQQSFLDGWVWDRNLIDPSGGGDELFDSAIWSGHYDACKTRINPRSDPMSPTDLRQQSFVPGTSFLDDRVWDPMKQNYVPGNNANTGQVNPANLRQQNFVPVIGSSGHPTAIGFDQRWGQMNMNPMNLWQQGFKFISGRSIGPATMIPNSYQFDLTNLRQQNFRPDGGINSGYQLATGRGNGSSPALAPYPQDWSPSKSDPLKPPTSFRQHNFGPIGPRRGTASSPDPQVSSATGIWSWKSPFDEQ